MNLDALWHDLECGGYIEDLPLWRALARNVGGVVLDVGAGTGRVTIDLAASGVEVVAMDVAAPLLQALACRAAGLPVETVLADAREFTLRRRFSLMLVAMQTLQLLGGAGGRAAFLRRALAHLEPGGLLAAAVADATGCFDEEHPLPPRPDACDIAGLRYSTQLLEVIDEGDRAVIHRRREISGPAGRHEAHDVLLSLDRISADQVAQEAIKLGFIGEPHLFVPETDEYLGSTVVVLRAPSKARSGRQAALAIAT